MVSETADFTQGGFGLEVPSVESSFRVLSAHERGVCLSEGIRTRLVTLAKTLVKLWDKAQGTEVRSGNLLYAAGEHLAKMQFINERVAKFFVVICFADFCRNITWEILGWLLCKRFL